MNEVEKNMAVSALAQLLDQQPTAYAEVLAACRAMGWNASPTAQPADIIDELPSNVLPFIRRMLALLIYGDGSSDSPAVVPVTERCYAQLVPRVTSPNYPAAGFPSDRDPFTHAPSIRDFAHLPQALSALSARKISGVPEAPDGISLAHLLCGSDAANAVTEIVDDNSGYDGKYRNLVSIFPNVENVTLGFKTLVFADNVYPGVMFTAPMKRINMPGVKHIRMVYGGGGGTGVFYNLPEGSEIIAPDCEKIESYGGNYPVLMHSLQGVVMIVLGKLTSFSMFSNSTNAIKLIHFEIGAGTAISLNFSKWNPSYVLSDNPTGTDLIEEGSTAQNNLDQFLQNFRSHIALRLTDNGSGKTLTLSQAVYDAIKDETHLFVFDEGTMTIYAYLTNIKHWTVTK